MKIAEVSRNRPSLSLSPVSPVNYIVMKSAIFDRRSFHRGLPLIKFSSFSISSISPRRYSLRHPLMNWIKDGYCWHLIWISFYLCRFRISIFRFPPPLIIEPDYLDRMLPIRHCQFNRLSMGGTNGKRFSIRSNSSSKFIPFHMFALSLNIDLKLFITINFCKKQFQIIIQLKSIIRNNVTP